MKHVQRALILLAATALAVGCVPESRPYECGDCAMQALGQKCPRCTAKGGDVVLFQSTAVESGATSGATVEEASAFTPPTPCSIGQCESNGITACPGTPGACTVTLPPPPAPALKYITRTRQVPVTVMTEVKDTREYTVLVPRERDIEVPAMRCVPKEVEVTCMEQRVREERVETKTTVYRKVPREVKEKIVEYVNTCIVDICNPCGVTSRTVKCPVTKDVVRTEYDLVPEEITCVTFKKICEEVPVITTQIVMEPEYYMVPAKTIECVEEIRTEEICKMVPETVMVDMEYLEPVYEIGLVVQMEDSHDPVFVGDSYSYVISVANQGTKAATNLRLFAELDEQGSMEFITSSGASVVTRSADNPRKLEFAPVATLEPGTQADWQVVIKAVSADDGRFHISVHCDEKNRPIEETESTNIVDRPW